VFVGDVLDAPYPPESFDVVTCFHVLEHLNNAQAHLILATCVNETDGRALLLLVAFP
jgi:2-polyprenyl-3-methyl-5-hydroxy-6-metoxy-1,4-benzoquinol methylase